MSNLTLQEKSTGIPVIIIDVDSNCFYNEYKSVHAASNATGIGSTTLKDQLRRNKISINYSPRLNINFKILRRNYDIPDSKKYVK